MSDQSVNVNLHRPEVKSVQAMEHGTVVAVQLGAYPITTTLFFEDAGALAEFAARLYTETERLLDTRGQGFRLTALVDGENYPSEHTLAQARADVREAMQR